MDGLVLVTCVMSCDEASALFFFSPFWNFFFCSFIIISSLIIFPSLADCCVITRSHTAFVIEWTGTALNFSGFARYFSCARSFTMRPLRRPLGSGLLVFFSHPTAPWKISTPRRRQAEANGGVHRWGFGPLTALFWRSLSLSPVPAGGVSSYSPPH